jgi:hypothetical protein
LGLKTHTYFECAASLATLDKLVDRFPLPPVSPPIGDTSLTHVIRLAAHSTTYVSPTPTTMGQSFIITLYEYKGINLLNTRLKLTTRIITQKSTERIQLKEEEQGFRSGRSCTDAIFIIRENI